MSDILVSAADPTLAAALEANFTQQYTYFRKAPQATVCDDDTITWVASGIPIAEYNAVTRLHLPSGTPQDTLDATITATIAAFGARGLSFTWWIGPTTRPPDLALRLLAHGLTHLGEGPGMAVDLDTLPAHVPTPEGLTIAPVDDDAALEAWVRMAGAGYGEPEDVLQARLAVHTSLGLAPGLPLRRYLARLDGQPVAMSAYFLAAGVVGVYEVATLPAARRQGIGAAITLAPLLAARKLGYHVGVLESSPMGVGVYTSLGFHTCCSFDVFSWEL
ncbi:MAG TPA: GNAT family N-acetyltransferase [Ktedonobacterales bacterium]|nr:GNAT family N-acetyltransferase [Ktedonobacterales bacterium]